MPRKKSNRGGKRPGSGRKKIPGLERLQIYIPGAISQIIKENSLGAKSYGDVVSEAIAEKYNVDLKKDVVNQTGGDIVGT